MYGRGLVPPEKLHLAVGYKRIQLIFPLSFLVMDLNTALDYNLILYVAIANLRLW